MSVEVAKQKKMKKYCDLFYILVLWNTLCSFYTYPSVLNLKLFFIMAKLCKVTFLHAVICDFPAGRLSHRVQQKGVCP